MDSVVPERLTRRRSLGLLVAGTLAGCLGSVGSDTEDDGETRTGTNDTTDTAGSSELPGDGSANADTSPADGCGSVFGDTDERYEPGERPLVASFAYPIGGRISSEADTSRESLTLVNYGNSERGQQLSVAQRAAPESQYDVDTIYGDRPGWQTGRTVRYDGTDRPVVTRQADDSETWLFRTSAGDEPYELEVRTSALQGEPCPAAYTAVCERVANSFEPV